MADIQNNPGALIPVPSGRFLAGREFWANFSRNRGAVVAGAIVLILVFIAIFAPLIAPHSPIEQYRDNVKIPPAWLDGGNWRFVLGTDEAGRVALYRGVPYELPFGVKLYSERYSAPVQTEALPERRKDAVTGHDVRSHSDAVKLLEEIERGQGVSQ